MSIHRSELACPKIFLQIIMFGFVHYNFREVAEHHRSQTDVSKEEGRGVEVLELIWFT